MAAKFVATFYQLGFTLIPEQQPVIAVHYTRTAVLCTVHCTRTDITSFENGKLKETIYWYI